MERSLIMAPETGPGEAREKARGRNRMKIIAALFVAGLIPGFYLGYVGDDGLPTPGAWPPAAVIMIAATYLVAVTWGGWLLWRQLDEVQRHVYSQAASAAAGLYVLVYPVWYLLWMGGLVREPMHVALFVLFYFGHVVALLYYRRKSFS
jgi:hypothetical protein